MTTEDKPKTKTVYEAVGEPYTVSLVPLDTGDGFARERDVTFQFCHKVKQTEGKPDQVAGHAYQVTATRIVDGAPEEVDKRHAKAEKAFEMLLGVLNTSPASYEAIDFDQDYFKQKAKKPEKPAFDPAAEVTFNGETITLSGMAGVLEEKLDHARESGVAQQADWIEFSKGLHVVYDALGQDHKRLSAWAQSASSNMPLLAALGKGTNALREALRFAEMSERERLALFVSTTNGKVIDRQRMEGLRAVIEQAAEEYAAEHDYDADKALTVDDKDGQPIFDNEGARTFLRMVARTPLTFDIADAMDLTEAEVCQKVDERAAAKLGEFIAEGGPHASAYDKSMVAWQRKTLGMVHIAFDDEDEQDKSSLNASHSFRKSFDYLKRIEAAQGKDKEVEALEKQMRSTKSQPLLAMAISMIEAACAEHEQTKQRRDLVEKVEGDEGEKEGIKTARKKLATMEFGEAVAAVAKYASARNGDKLPNDAVKVLREAAKLLSEMADDKEDEQQDEAA